MKRKILTVVLILMVLEGLNFFIRSKKFSGDPGKDFGSLPGAYQSKEFENGSLRSLSYWVKMDFPASDAVQFYENKLTQTGWTPVESSRSNAFRTWTASIRQDPQSAVPDCGYIYQSVWINEKIGWTAAFTLTYYDASPSKVCPPGPKNNELVVTIRESPKTQ